MAPEEIAAHLNSLTKPPGSLGKLERIAAELMRITGELRPQFPTRRLVIFAADHGVVAAGVSAWPSAVTSLMIQNMLRGGAASSVFARQFGVSCEVVNVGTLEPVFVSEGSYRDARIGPGTKNLAVEPAMTLAEFDQALEVGRRSVSEADWEIAGEMGIGNTTASAALISYLCDIAPSRCVGRGAGADDETLTRKMAIVETAVSRAKGMADPREAMASLAGFEIVAMAGFYSELARRGKPVLLDGVISTAAALVAVELDPKVKSVLIASHRSAEPAHTFALDRLGLTPILDGWEMRLGEGTGALLALPLLDAACAMTREMGTFADLGIGS
ncbi:MAG: nicotinate-nucleotide--dimethylbenzimidazole phosphoribosyltransferase [Fimbriiglobus sp.]